MRDSFANGGVTAPFSILNSRFLLITKTTETSSSSSPSSLLLLLTKNHLDHLVTRYLGSSPLIMSSGLTLAEKLAANQAARHLSRQRAFEARRAAREAEVDTSSVNDEYAASMLPPDSSDEEGESGLNHHKEPSNPPPPENAPHVTGAFHHPSRAPPPSSEPEPEKPAMKKKRGKNAPLELASKTPVPYTRAALYTADGRRKDGRVKRIDPRFSELSGEFDFTGYRRAYEFVDTLREREANELTKASRGVSGPAAANLKKAAMVIKSRMATEKDREEKLGRRKERFRKEREAVANGKKPFYMKASEEKRLDLLDKYEGLKAKGGVDKYMKKRRQKLAAKDHKLIPRSRRRIGDE